MGLKVKNETPAKIKGVKNVFLLPVKYFQKLNSATKEKSLIFDLKSRSLLTVEPPVASLPCNLPR